jgi:hypothetical protein
VKAFTSEFVFPNVSRGTLVKKLTNKIIKKGVDRWGVWWYN